MSDKNSPIRFLNEFQRIAEIVSAIKNKINSKTDVVWTGFNTPDELEKYLVDYIEKLQSGDHESLSRIYLMFLPTGTFQELAISNGWGDEYIKLVEKFDYYHKKIKAG